MEMERFIDNLLGQITAHCYVNAYSEIFLINKDVMKTFQDKLTEERTGLSIDVDIQKFRTFETEDEEAIVIQQMINDALKKEGVSHTIEGAMSITGALDKLSKLLTQSALMVFHFFADEYNEKEKDILRSIRKYLEIYEKSPLLGILLLSHKRVYNWELYPESNIDDRHVEFFEYKLFQKG